MTAKPGTTPQSTLTSTFFNPLAVTVKDATGIPLPGVSVTFTSPATGPSAYANFYPNPATAHTDNSGVVSLPFFASSFAGGPYAVTASTTGLPPVTFLLTNIAGPPVIQTYVQDQTAALLSTVVFTVFVYEYPYPPVRWQVSTNGGVTFTDIPGATLTTLTLTAVTFSMNGNQYRAVVTNAVGSTSTMPANLTVNRPAPVITWANPADITAGTALGSTQLNATASVSGSFAYVPAAGTVLAEGSGQTLTAVFTPTDSNNFMVALKSVTINVLSSAVPSVLSLTPVTSSTSTQTFTLQFSHPSGYTSLSVLNVLINSALDGRKGCYLAYVQQTNTAYLVNDAGDASAPFAGALVLNGSGTSIGNSQCSITAAGSSAVGAGTTLTLTLNMTFTASFAGNKVIYAAARDSAQGNSGWQTLGVHGVPGSPVTYPNSVSMSPASGSTSSAAITFSYQDATSAANLQTVWALVNTALDGRAACYVAYYRPGNLLFLIPDNGDGSQATSIVLSGTNTLSNSQCTISAQGSSVSTPTAGTLAVTLNIAFKSGFTGPKAVWMAGQTLAGQTSAWQSLGAWRVP